MANPRKSLNRLIETKSAEWLDKQPAWLGDYSAVVQSEVAGVFYARIINGKVIEVYNQARVPPTYDLIVLIGRRRSLPNTWQIIEVVESYTTPAASGQVEYHHEQHMLGAGDMLPVDRRQILQLAVLVSDPANFVVTLIGDVRLTSGGYVKIDPQTVDLSSYVVSAGAKYVSIESDEDGALSVNEGTLFEAPSAATAADLPVPAIGKHTRAHVLLYEGQTALSDLDISVPWPPDLNPLEYVRRFPDQPAAPTVDDDSTAGYRVTDIWIYTDAYGTDAYICLDDTDGAADWLNLSTGAGSADYTDISANDADTDVTGAELEELTDGSETTLHSHAGEVTNGDSHDHNGGDGAQISFLNLSNAFNDAEGDPAAVATAAADGTSTYAARRDHAHAGGKTLLYDQTLGSTAGSINVYPTGSIPAGKHLHIRVTLRTDKAGVTSEGVKIEINDDAGNNYSCYVMWHNFDSSWNDQSQAAGAPVVFGFANAATAPSNEFATYDITITDYAATDKNKTFQSRGGQRLGTTTSTMFIYDALGSWHPATPVAITKVEFLPADGNSFIAGCRVTAWIEG